MLKVFGLAYFAYHGDSGLQNYAISQLITHTHLAAALCHWYSQTGLCHTAEKVLSTAAWSPTVLRSQTRPFGLTVSCQTCLTGKTIHSTFSSNKTQTMLFGYSCETERKYEPCFVFVFFAHHSSPWILLYLKVAYWSHTFHIMVMGHVSHGLANITGMGEHSRNRHQNKHKISF